MDNKMAKYEYEIRYQGIATNLAFISYIQRRYEKYFYTVEDTSYIIQTASGLSKPQMDLRQNEEESLRIQIPSWKEICPLRLRRRWI